MKNIAKFLTLTLAVAFMFTACNNNQPADNASHEINLDDTRGIQMVDFQGSQVAVSKADIVAVTKAENAAADDDAVNNLMRNLMGAENEAQLLDVNFTMSDEPVEEGLFVFGVEAEEAKELTFEMYDEEGFEMAANNTIDINAGNNYKALNVKSLDNGTYFFKLKDDAGKELTRQVKISHKE